MPDDLIVKEAVQAILSYESPALPLQEPPTAEYYKQLAQTVSYMTSTFVPTTPVVGTSEGEDPRPDLHLHNLRAWAFQQAIADAEALLAELCGQIGIEAPVQGENAILLVRALRAFRLSCDEEHPRRYELLGELKKCVLLLEALVSVAPQGSAADLALQETAELEETLLWFTAPWETFVQWLNRRLPEGEAIL